jgi:glycosyltransferase involved in cell wall biosynthesis
MFPHLLSAFRITEFNALLQHFKNAAVYSNGITFRTIGDSRDFKEVYAEYADLYPNLSSRVHFFNVKTKVSARLCYVMFLNNAILFIDYIERCKLPFVVELYPGGGFQLYNQDSDQKLRRVVSSPLFKKIIVTQKISYDYLLDNLFCRADQIEMIYGGVFPQEQLLRVEMPRLLYPVSKKTFSICFVAHKYMPQGRDKGYDIFIETARILVERHPEIYFHVVGPYGPEDLPVSDLGVRIKFHGSCTTDFFPDFYSKMDLILSPNIPFVLAPGAFDGFPTGACMEAGMCGTAVFCCDELELNPFVNGEEIVIIPRNHFEISNIISEYVKSPDKLHQVAQKGQQRFKKVFSLKDQMDPRISVLEECMQTKG